MDRMLHRGKYALDVDGNPAVSKPPSKFSLQSWIGIDEHFSRGDKILSWSVFIWSMAWFVIFIVVTAWNLIAQWSVKQWSTYWHYELVIIPLLISGVTTIWFTWGGVRDLKRLFSALKTVKRNANDDGMVVNHHNLEEE